MDASYVDEQNRRRFAFLRHLYEVGGGDRHQIVSQFELGQEIGLSPEDSSRVSDYLEGEGLLKNATLGGGISITHEGIVQIERALGEPDTPTQFFPPVNVIYAETITNSQIQQGTVGSSQTTGISAEALHSLQQFVGRARAELPKLGAPTDIEAELHSELTTLEAQVTSPRPKARIIAESLRSVRNILEGMTGSALATALLEFLSRLQH